MKYFLINQLANNVPNITLHGKTISVSVSTPLILCPRTSLKNWFPAAMQDISKQISRCCHPGLINMQETGWLFGERCNTILACVIDSRWEKHERSRESQWNESPKLVAILFKPVFSKSTCNQFVICHLRPPPVWPLSLCWCSEAEEVGQGKDKDALTGLKCTFPFTDPIKSTYCVGNMMHFLNI